MTIRVPTRHPGAPIASRARPVMPAPLAAAPSNGCRAPVLHSLSRQPRRGGQVTLPVHRVPTTSRSRGRPAGLFIVTEPDRTEVVVRFCPSTANAPPLWRCTGCDTRSRTTDCLHTFSVGIHLARPNSA